MANDMELGIRIRINADGTASVINGTSQSIQQLGLNANNATGHLQSMSSATQGLGNTLRSLGSIAATAFAGLGLAEMARGIFDVNRELNATRQQLANLEGSAGAAASRFAELNNYAIAPIVGVKSLAEAYLRLKNLALDANQSILTGYANIAASSPGKKIGDVIEAVADAATGEFERLKEFGIKASQSGGMVAMSFQGVTTTVKNNATEIQKYLQTIGNVNFAGAIENQLKTIDGALSKIKNTASNWADNLIGASGESAIAGMLSSFADALPAIGDGLVIATAGLLGFAAAEGVVSLATVGMTGVIETATAAMLMLSAVNPFTALIAILTATAAAAYLYRDALVSIGDTNASVSDWLQATWITVKNTAMEAIDTISAAMPTLGINAGSVGSFIVNVFRDAWSIVGNLARLAANLVIGNFNAVGNAMGIIAAGIVNNFSQAFSKVKAMAAGLASGVKAAMSGDFSFSALGAAYNQTANFVNVAGEVKAALGKAFSTDYVGNFGKRIASTAADLHMVRTMTDAHGAAMQKAAKHAKDLGDANKDAADKADKHAKATKKLTDEQKELKKLLEDAARLTESLATPTEKYNSEIDKLNKMLATVGVSFETTYSRGIEKANDELLKNTKGVQENIKALDDLKAALDLADYASSLQDLGLSPDAIKNEIDQYKQMRDAINASPTLPPGKVAETVAQRIKAEDVVKTVTDKNTKAATDYAKVAWEQATKNIQDSLGGAIENALSGKGMQSFADFAKSIKDVLFKTISQSISAALIEGFKAGDWSNLVTSGAMALASAAVGWLSKSNKASGPSIATKGASKEAFGTGAMAIADVSGRDFFETSTIESVRQWNASVDFISNALQAGALKVWEASGAYVDKLTSAFSSSAVGQFLNPLVEGVKTAFNTVSAWGTQIWNGISNLFTSATSLVSTSASAVNGINSVISTGAGAGAATAAEGASKVPYVGTALAILKLGYDLFSIAGNDMLTTVEQISHSLWAAGDALFGIALATMNPVVAIGAAVVNTVGSITDMFENGFTRENLSRLFLGPLASLLFPPRTPNAWMNTFSNDRGLALTDRRDNQTDKNGMDFWTRETNKGGFIGVETAFGAVELSLHELKRFNEQDLIPSYTPLLQTIKAYDRALGSSIQAVDEYYNQTGQTLGRFNEKLWDGIKGTRIATKQDLSDMSTASMVSDRFQGIGKILSEVDTVAGRTAGTWIKAFSEKLLKPGTDNAEYNQTTTFNIEAFVAANLFDLTQLPLRLVDLFVRSVRSVAEGATQAEFEGQFSDFFSGFMIAKEGLKQAGIDMSDAVPGYLASLMDIGMTVKEGASVLATFAGLYKNRGEEFNRAFNDLMSQAKQGGYGREQTAGYLSSFMTFANVANDLKISATNAQLNNLASSLIRTAQASTQTANDVIDHAIADAKLTAISREAATEQLRVAGTLDESTIAAAQFGKALAEAQAKILGGIEYANTLGLMFGTTVGGLGISFKTVTNLGAGLVNTFGDVANSMKFLDSWAKSVLSDDAYKAMNAGIARAKFNSAASAVGMSGLSIDQFKSYSQNPQVQANLINLLGSTDEKNQALARSYVTLINAGVNLIEIDKQAAGSVKEVATSIDALVDKFKDVNEAFKAIGVSDLQQNLNKIKADLTSYNQAVVDSFVARGSTEADRPLAEQQFLRNTIVAVDQAQKALKPLFDEFQAIGKSDLQKSMEGITTWYAETLQSVGDIALAYNISNQQAIDGITAIKDARIAALDKEISYLSKIKSYVEQLRLGDKSPLTNQQQFAEARAQFGTQLSLARAGDKNALENITSYADTYLSKSRTMFASSGDYTSIFDSVTTALDGLGVTAGVGQSLEIAKQQRDYLKAIADYVTNPANAANAIMAGSVNGGYAATSATAPSMPLGGVGPLAPMDTGANLLSTFNRLITEGDYLGAANVAKTSGYSMPEVAGYVEQQYGMPATDVMQWFTDNGYAFANGGSYAGGMALVGERGPELINFDAPGQIFTAPQTKSILSGGNDAETKALLKEMIAELRALRQSGDTGKISAAMDRLGAMLDQRTKEQTQAQREAVIKAEARKEAVRLS